MNAITLYKQIHPCQCQTLHNMGYKSLINLRFDNECDSQPCNQELANTATKAGLLYAHLPVDGECMHLETVATFAKLLKDSPKPVMVFCSTGSRAKRIYQSAKIEGLID